MRWRLGGGALLVAIALGACATAGVSERAPPADTLAWLREELRKVRATPADQSYAPEGWRDRKVSVLIGMKRGELALGPPDVCDSPGAIPCYFPSDTVYVFFRLHQKMGGGPHLVLSFDERDVCRRSRWVGTK